MPLIDDITLALTRRKSGRLLHVPDVLANDYALYETDLVRLSMLRTVVIGTLVLIGLLSIDWMFIPDVWELNAAARIGLGLPGGILTFLYIRKRGTSPSQQIDAGLAFAIFCSLLCSAVLAVSRAEAAPIYMTANNVVLAFAIAIMRPPPLRAACVTAIIIGIVTIAVLIADYPSIGIAIATVGVTAALSVPLLYSNWMLENERRRVFLNQKRDELRLREIAESRDMLERLAALDPLTGLRNRRGFDAILAAERERHDSDVVIAIAMIDIDNFKRFNDLYGHPAGDEALRRVADALATKDTGGYRVARLGGEEFAVALFDIEPRSLEFIGSQLRAAIVKLAIEHRGNAPHDRLTISVGMAWSRASADDLRSLFSRADTALYAAKAAGRNAVIINPPLDELKYLAGAA